MQPFVDRYETMQISPNAELEPRAEPLRLNSRVA